jgi:hypothetical protein
MTVGGYDWSENMLKITNTAQKCRMNEACLPEAAQCRSESAQ